MRKEGWVELVAKEDAEKMKPIIASEGRADRRSRGYEARIIDKHGSPRDVYLYTDMIPGSAKSVASLMDITEIKRTEEALRRSEEASHRLAQETYPLPRSDGSSAQPLGLNTFTNALPTRFES